MLTRQQQIDLLDLRTANRGLQIAKLKSEIDKLRLMQKVENNQILKLKAQILNAK